LTAAGTPFRALLDAGVPVSVGKVINAAGFEVLFHRDVLPEKTPDEVVCITAEENQAVLIAVDHDMKQMAKQYGVTPAGNKHSTLNIIRICCGEVMAAARIDQAIPLIMLEWEFCCAKTARRMWVDVGQHYLKTHR
jgi:predicted nuclease of predicted toxin-antitoxin system